jgi:hypothetical protein
MAEALEGREKPSMPNATPKTSPKLAMKFGHRRPISNDRIVPLTTPTANRISTTFDQRMAMAL